MTAESAMLILKALDTDVAVVFSEWTGKWYVSASIEVGDGSILSGESEHRDTPADAILAYFRNLTGLDTKHYVVSRYRGHRREWRWNGAAFAEITRQEALAPGVSA